jgi:hypothetical protein
MTSRPARQAESQPAAPRPSEPLPSEPLPSEPLPSEPLPSEPLPSEPWPSEPLLALPLPGEPLPGGPLPREPLSADPPPAHTGQESAGLPPEAGPGSPWLASPPSGRWIALTAAAAVVVIAGASVTLATEHQGGNRPGTTTRTGGRAPAAGSRRPGPARHPGSAPGRHAKKLVVLTKQAAKAPDAHPVSAFLTRYFTAIDHHSYTAYRSLYSPLLRPELSAAAFTAGYGTTKDSRAVLRSIFGALPGHVHAVVSFTSHQSAADSPTHTSCTTWTISLYLVRSGASYVIISPPRDYQPSFRACS